MKHTETYIEKGETLTAKHYLIHRRRTECISVHNTHNHGVNMPTLIVRSRIHAPPRNRSP